MIALAGVGRRYGAARALDGIDLEVEAGVCAVVFGANGAGKTTLLKLCAGLLRPTSGTVLVAGRPPREVRARIGYAGHEVQMYPQLTVGENLTFQARIHGLPASAARQCLESTGLIRRWDDPLGTLSRGQKQRVSLARALINDPDLLLADEPFSGLDEESAAALPAMILRPGRTLLIATHDTDRGKAIADLVVNLSDGRLVP